MRYDAAIIGAGANGLAAAAVLAGAGLKVVVLERGQCCGGRAATREFHPGFRASPFADDMAPIPAELFRALDLARHGAVFLPAPSSLALWPDRRDGFFPWADSISPEARLRGEAARRVAAILARASADASRAPERNWFGPAPEPAPWPGEDWSRRSLADLLDESLGDDDSRAHLMAAALGGRAADPFVTGTALHLLAPGGSGIVMGGFATLGDALAAAARAAGAEISLGLDVADIRHRKHRASGVCLADGTEISARAVISTLDLRRTFLSLFAWKDLPRAVIDRVSSFRQAAGTARLLLALDAPPLLPTEIANGPIHVSPSASGYAIANAAWRAGTVPDHPPLTVRLVSIADPSLAPSGKAVVTATLGDIPHQLFDGPWTHDKRSALRDRALADIDSVMPGTKDRVVAADLIVPPDIEDALGASAGDLDGGEIAPDQMFGWRGFAHCPGGRTPIAGLYLGGPSTPVGPLASAASGVLAARAIMADLDAGRIK